MGNVAAVTSPDLTATEIESARRVLKLEAQGITALSDALNDDFKQAVTILQGVTGRVIITGMGKSGHIATKVAATLASTGTPSTFVHPAEASHGDLGMITDNDAVIAFSNSGETTELADLITFTTRFHLPLIAITGRAASTLAEAATVALILPDIPEACPMGLAPTTSTTTMLALGDALAVALLERKGFSADDFHLLHPGGKLGQRLLRVSRVMHTGEAMPIVSTDTPMTEVLITMSAKSFGCVGIVDANGQLGGIITDGDLRRHMSREMLDQPAAAVMTPHPKTIRPDALASEALAILNDNSITILFVVDHEKPVGIVHVHDCLRAGIA